MKQSEFDKMHYDAFMESWELYIPEMRKEDVYKAFDYASPYHPNETMQWLYDRLIFELVKRSDREI